MVDKNNGCKYRNWSKIEDAKLVDALVNMVNVGGYKADNGFKSGYLQHLKQALKISLSDSNILGEPHIESKIKTMKKIGKLYMICYMVQTQEVLGTIV